MSMPPDWVLEQYRGPATQVIYGMMSNPSDSVQLDDGRIVQRWMIEAAKLHVLRLQLDALRNVGLA